ncbi:acetoacetyl-CoA synthetase isoform X1-like [Tropilaelaps mercedesae]|uniref:Acetoacetyl-CoA synthetase isoform X1-like n=1 Tax=Tropilaelaps mercedesae TaxID=418985 RepID=A0A1V9X0K7_9ACAR|nr:acetoacetyl-CoA synthetase isoform X1-like [Tropilaelaps mercedesae]
MVATLPVMEVSTPTFRWNHLLLKRPNKKQDRFRNHINEKFGLHLADYHDLYRWSVEHYPLFWEEFLSFSEIIISLGYTQVVEDVPMEKIPKWFIGCTLSFTENLLRGEADSVALYATDERLLSIKKVTFGELRLTVARYATALRKLGVGPGDRVCGYVANTEHTVIAFLATASIGAVWSATSPDLGYRAVINRFQQIQPKVIFSVDRQIYNKKIHDKIPILKSILEQLTSVEQVIIIPFDGNRVNISLIPNALYVDDWLTGVEESPKLQYEKVSFSAPLCILFTSGTTGRPKCIVHSVGGTLIQHRKEHELLGDLNEDDTLFYYTTTGWMMWNWLISGLAANASLVLYEGSPLLRDSPYVLLDLAARVGVTVFGTSAKYLSSLEDRLTAGSPDAKGELVCCSPFPSMPVFFWGDESGSLYHQTYFERFPGVWYHGDFCCINTNTGGIIMLGRSDATLNPNGVRFGSTEIYNIVDTISSIQDSVCVSYVSKKTNEEKVVLLLKMKPSCTLTDDLRSTIRTAIRNSLSPRHVPALITQVDDIPYTMNAKKVEVAVRKVINGDNQVDTSTLANPECLQRLKKLCPTLAALD